MSSNTKWWVLSMAGGGLLGLANFSWSAFLVVPGLAFLLQVGKEIQRESAQKFGYVPIFLGLYLWQVLGLWSLLPFATVPVLLYGFVNAALFTLPFLLYHISLKASGQTFGYLLFISYWLTFEYITETWVLAWPWLHLGNLLGHYPALVGWYNLTGPAGGTLWVLLVAPLARQTFFEGRNRLVFPATVLFPALLAFFFFEPGSLADEAAILQQKNGAVWTNQQPVSHSLMGRKPQYPFSFSGWAQYADTTSLEGFTEHAGFPLAPLEPVFVTETCELVAPDRFAMTAHYPDSVVQEKTFLYRRLCSLGTGKPFLYFLGDGWRILPVGSTEEQKLPELPTEVRTSTQQTFFAKSGNYLGRLAAFLAAIMFLSAFVKSTINKGSRSNRKSN